MNDQILLGQSPKTVERDAVHVAILPLVAGTRLLPGQKVQIRDNVAHASLFDTSAWDGVVDPFLVAAVEEGERVYICMRPGTVTGMRHLWSHPVDDQPETPKSKADAYAWLDNFCGRWNLGDTDGIIGSLEIGDYVTAYGKDLHSRSDLGKDHDLLWANMEIWLGRKFDERHREEQCWSCSC